MFENVRLIPFFILAGLSLVSLGINWAEHGRPRDNHNAWTSLISLILTWGLIIWMIW